MITDFDNMKLGDYVMITSSVELEDNAKLYSKGESEWIYITDFSGATGIQGPKGDKGEQGVQGIQGIGIKSLEVRNGYLFVILTNDVEKNAGLIITDEVKQWLVTQITGNAESDFNTYYNGKKQEFDENAELKKQEFDLNAQNKINEYDEHAVEFITRLESVEALIGDINTILDEVNGNEV